MTHERKSDVDRLCALTLFHGPLPRQNKSVPTDGSGKMLPAGAVTSETIGRSENGLRVEISLKYRRLLVQKLAQESLLSAKDHESFRSARPQAL